MHDVTVIDDPAAAEASLDPIRARLLSALAEPGSATTLATRTGLTRQKANYHLRALERHGLIELVEERRKGNCTERVLQATAASYVISPTALSAVAPDPRARRISARRAGCWPSRGGWCPRSASSSPAVGRRRQAGRDPRHRQRGPLRVGQDRAAFAAELADAVNGLVAKYHDEHATGGRKHRFVVALHPRITNDTRSPGHESRIRDHPRGRPARRAGGCLDRDHRRHRCLAVPDGWRSPQAARRPGRAGSRPGIRRTASSFGWRRPTARSTRSSTRSRRATGGTAHLSYVHSGILADDWEDQYDGSAGTPTLPAHARAVPRALQRPPVTYVGQPSAGIEGPRPPASGGDGHATRGARDRRRRGGGRRGPRRRRRRLLDGVIDDLTAEFMAFAPTTGS